MAFPKPPGESVTRHKKTFEWQFLPAEGRQGPPPKLPAYPITARQRRAHEKNGGRKPTWSKAARDLWVWAWSTPQATKWDDNDPEILRMVVLFDRFWKGEANTAELGEIRAIEDRHGLNPRALMSLRWIIGEPEPVEVSKPPAAKNRRLKVV